MRGVQFGSYGDPEKVLACVELPELEAPVAGQALVQVEFAPVNQNDLMIPRGIYGTRPPVPALMGNEGVAHVLAVGSGVTNVHAGDRVAPPLGSMTWRDRLLVDAATLFPLPKGADPKQLAMLTVNPPTASLLLSEFAPLERGDWVVQNAANSGVGRWVIAFAKKRGLRTVNVVRRPELIEELKRLGGDVVIVDGAELANDVAKATRGAVVRLGLDGVGGEASGRVAAALGLHGTLAIYATTTKEPMAVSPLDAMFKSLTVRGFWMGHPEYASKLVPAMREAARMIEAGEVAIRIAGVYPIGDVKKAAAHAAKGAKVLLEIAP
jgi:NADPH:quinone reductase-like Zn-dependent oxidoreductase